MLKTIVRLMAALAVLGAFGGCTGTGGKGTRPDRQPVAVEDRAVKRWDLLIAGKADEAYEYLTPGYRQTHPKDPYVAAMSNRPVKWKTAKFARKECESEDACTVYLHITYELRIHAGIDKPVEGFAGEEEHWLKVDGNWYHLPQK